MLNVTDALDTIIQHTRTGPVAQVPLQECLNSLLAQDLTTPHDSPPFDKSMMDGFTVNSQKLSGDGTITLPVAETITAGTVPSRTLDGTAASRIMTGAPLPPGADCVIPVERVTFDESAPDTVTIPFEHINAERHVLRQGGSAKTGENLIAGGTRLAPQHIAVLAEFGVAQIPVHQQPTVAVLATGDELLAINEPLTPGRIRNSNEPMLVSQIRRCGATPVPLGVAKDRREDLAPLIKRGLECDFLLLSGGVSAGTLDLVPSELEAAGVTEVFHKIQMKPGKPLWFGKLEKNEHNCHVFGLPGNPVSSMICYELFVRSAIRKFSGDPQPDPTCVDATLTEEIGVKGNRPTYFPSKLQIVGGRVEATPVPWGGSADLRSTANANGMCLLNPKPTAYSAGEQVPAIYW